MPRPFFSNLHRLDEAKAPVTERCRQWRARQCLLREEGLNNV